MPDVEDLIQASGADLRLGGDPAFCNFDHDFVQVSRPEAYFEPINLHRTALHELGHWAGAQPLPGTSDRKDTLGKSSWSK